MKAESFGRVNRFTEEFRKPLVSPLNETLEPLVRFVR
jgi:hypothetical protein